MNNLLIIVLAVVDGMVALLLIAVVLVQQSKDGGLGGSPFGGAGDAVFGGQAADYLTKITVVLTTIFLLLTLSLAIITGRRTNNDMGVVEETPAAQSADMTPPPKPKPPKQVKKSDNKIMDKIDGITKKATAKTKPETKAVKTTKKVEVNAKAKKAVKK